MNASILVEEYQTDYSALVAMAYKMLRNIHDAEDAVATAYARAVERIQQYDPRRGTLFQWLRVIALHTIADLKRQRRMVCEGDGRIGVDFARVADTASTPLEEVVRTEKQILTAEHIMQDPLLMDHYFNGLSYREIGEKDGTCLGTMQSRFYRAYARARKALEHLTS